ncbi:MAG: cobalamin-dependent protein [Thermoleophilia bacterium]|nr:cobalamin-dependent protein [Thermoleophilia bacterium]
MDERQYLERIKQALVDLNRDRLLVETQAALDEGVDPTRIIKEGLSAGLLLVGDQWIRKERFISHVLVAAKAMGAAQELVEPHLAGDSWGAGKIVLGTIKGDLHDIGKNLVALMLRSGGFEVTDIGVDVPAERFVETAREQDADIVAISLLMSVCLDEVERACELIKGAQDVRARILVGGPPVSDAVAREIGADMYGGFDAVTALESARRLLSQLRAA